jgi:hypothetical protein
MDAYEQKIAARRERLENAASRASQKAQGLWDSASTMLDAIPMGQPILVGHHSERSDRAYRDRAQNKMIRSHEESKRAEELARKAASVGTGGVSSDDPDAVAKLVAQLEKCEKDQATYILINRYVRKGDREGLATATGYKPETIAKLFEKDYCGRVGIPDYVTKNNSANIRRLKARIEELRAKSQAPERAPVEGDGFRIVEDRDINRVCVEFDEKPSEAIRSELKSYGFRWSPNRGAWVRQTSNQAWYAAETATRALRGE